MSGSDDSLGMNRRIDRRDFLQGAAVAVGAVGLSGQGRAQASAPWPQDAAGYDPPALTGMRGSHPGSFEAAHALRDGDPFAAGRPLQETYDLIVVGGGISGLSSAWFWRRQRPDARILILDNHDDFGGHAKRNEFHLGGRLQLMNGGTLEIDSPRSYSPVADGLIRSLGIDPPALAKACDKPSVYRGLGLGHGVFFDRETFGSDALVAGAPNRFDVAGRGGASWTDFAARTPLPKAAQDDLVRIETGSIDYMPGLTSAQKKDALSRISYHDYLARIAEVHPLILAYYQTHTQGEWGVGIDAVSALDCWGFFMPGFQGLKLDPGPAPRMSFTPAGYCQGGSYTFHFPDGNASIARLLVRALVPGAIPGEDCRDVVGARADYARLDRPENPVRIRLSSTCIRARNLGSPQKPEGVEIAYVRGGQVFRVRGRALVMASWNMMIPYIVPQLPERQKAALHKIVKTPLVYTTVALADWTAFQKLGVSSVSAPGGYYTSFQLNWPVAIGAAEPVTDPAQPILLHMTRTPCAPGLPEHEQNKAGRAELLATPFSTFEREIRSQLGRTLAGGGFDSARDITAITVNRWPHGYAPEWNPLWGQVYAPGEAPNEIGRARFGAIAIANSDAGAAAYTDCAIDQAHRAVGELLAL